MSEYVLRPYQEESVTRSVQFLLQKKPKNGIVIIPSGGGKSLCIASLVKRLDAPCIVFQPSKELLEQNLSKFQSYGFNPSIYSASKGRAEVGEITLATIGSVKKCPELFSHCKYVIIDECHLWTDARGGMYADFINGVGDARILGFSATPFRLATNSFGSQLRFLTRTRPRIFQEVVHCTQNKELFDAGYLCPLKYYDIKGFDKSRLKINSTGADYTDESVKSYINESQFSDRIVKIVRRLEEIRRRGILVFTRFVDEAKVVSGQIPNSAVVSCETPKKERADIVAGFKSGAIKTICNVGIFGIGFDYPELDTVVLARPTRSLAVFYQQVGRCVRPHPLKPYSMVVDMVGLSTMFGHVEDLVIRDSGDGWCVGNGRKQLTNVYFEQDDNGEFSEVKPDFSGVPELQWSEPVEVETVRGKRILRKANPTSQFWGAWRSRKEELKACGISVRLDEKTGNYEVLWWS